MPPPEPLLPSDAAGQKAELVGGEDTLVAEIRAEPELEGAVVELRQHPSRHMISSFLVFLSCLPG